MRLRLRFLFLSALPLVTVTSDAQDTASRHVWSDFDGDGLPDLYVVSPGRDDVLLRNAGDGGFADATQEAGLAGLRSESVRPGDFDRDELEDLLLLSQDGELRLYRGLEGGAFAEAAGAGISLQGAPAAKWAEWVDYDRDGWVDLKVETDTGAPVLFRNVEGLFERVELGLQAPAAGDTAPTLVAPLAQPAEAVDQPPSLGGRIAVTGSGSGAGKQSLRLPDGAVAPVSPGGIETSQIDLTCAEAVRDASMRSECIQASSSPMLGMLYPLSTDWFVDPATGFMGVGTTNPAARLDVAGRAEIQGGLEVSGGIVDVQDQLMRFFEGDSGVATILANPNGLNSGGQLLLRTTDAPFAGAIDMRADAGNDDGQIILRDTTGGTVVDGLALRAQHVFGSGEGGVMTALNGEGVVTARVIGDNGADAGQVALRTGTGSNAITANLSGNAGSGVGELRLNEADNSRAFWMSADELTGSDSAGAETFSLNRQTGDATQASAANGFLKAAVTINGPASAVIRSFNNLPGGSVSVTRLGVGDYLIDLGVNIESRFWSVQRLGPDRLDGATIGSISGSTIRVQTYERGAFSTPVGTTLQANLEDGDFNLFVY